MLACLSPQISLLVITSLWILLPISYIAMEKPSNSNHGDDSENHHPMSFKDIPYSPVESNASDTSAESTLSYNEMLSLVWQTQPLFIGLFVGIFCKQLLVISVVTTIAFPNISVTPRNQYLLYVLVSGAGEMLGRPYLAYLSFCGIEKKFVVRKPWFLAFLNALIMIVMVFDSWFRFQFLSHFYSAAALVFVNNLLSGMLFVNTFHMAGEGLSVAERTFCHALLVGALWTALVAVALIGLNTESHLREHCVHYFSEVACFTRSPTAWEPSASCVL